MNFQNRSSILGFLRAHTPFSEHLLIDEKLDVESSSYGYTTLLPRVRSINRHSRPLRLIRISI